MKKLLILLVLLVAAQGAVRAQLAPSYWAGFDPGSLWSSGNTVMNMLDLSAVAVFDTTRNDQVHILMWTEDSTMVIITDDNQRMGPYRDPQVMVTNGEAYWQRINPPKEE